MKLETIIDPIKKPIGIEPLSPMKIFEGEIFQYRKPRNTENAERSRKLRMNVRQSNRKNGVGGGCLVDVPNDNPIEKGFDFNKDDVANSVVVILPLM